MISLRSDLKCVPGLPVRRHVPLSEQAASREFFGYGRRTGSTIRHKQVFSKRGGFCPFSFPHHSSRNMKITASMGGYSCATHLYRTSSRAAKNRHRPRLQVAVRSRGGARLARKLLVLVQDTIWIQCGFADIAKVSNSCHSSARSRFCGSKAKRGEGYDIPGLGRLSLDRDKSRNRGVEPSTRGLTENVSLAPDRRVASHCRGRTLSGRRFLYRWKTDYVRPPVSHGRRHLPVVGRDLSGLPYGRAVCDRRRTYPVSRGQDGRFDTRRDRRIGLAGSRKPLHSCLLFARRGGFVSAHGRRRACAPRRCRSLSRAAKGRRMRVSRCPNPNV